MNKIINSTQEWIPIKKIYDNGIIKINKKKYIKILKINPINYNLKSDLEKKSILNSYKILLKTCNFDIQILIQSSKQDFKNHIKNIKKNLENKKNSYIKEIYNNYINFIQKLNNSKNFSSKNFYLIISSKKIDNMYSMEIIENDLNEKYIKIKEALSRCGNTTREISDKTEIINIFKSFIYKK